MTFFVRYTLWSPLSTIPYLHYTTDTDFFKLMLLLGVSVHYYTSRVLRILEYTCSVLRTGYAAACPVILRVYVLLPVNPNYSLQRDPCVTNFVKAWYVIELIIELMNMFLFVSYDKFLRTLIHVGYLCLLGCVTHDTTRFLFSGEK